MATAFLKWAPRSNYSISSKRLIARTITGSDGRFAFAALPTDSYSVRVSLSSYLPVSRDHVAVKAGMNSLLQVHLASLLSNMEVTYAIPTAGMTNDWKWVLRASPATRAMTRFLPAQVSSSQNAQLFPKVFSGTHAMVTLSGGDSSIIDIGSGQGDLGTGFILSTNIFGRNLLQVGGNYAPQSVAGSSAMALVAIYTRDPELGFGEAPEVTLSVSQLSLINGPASSPSTAGNVSAPAVRTTSLSLYQTMDPAGNVHLEYGVTGESVDYLQHDSRLSPFGRLTVSGGLRGKLVASYSHGGRPDELSAHQQRLGTTSQDNRGDDLSAASETLTRLPQLAFGNNRLALQGTQSYELGYQRNKGSLTYSLSAFHEDVANGRVDVAGDVSSLNSGNLLSDGMSKTLIYDVGRYKRNGLIGSMNERLSDSLDFSVAYGRMGGFTATSGLGGMAQSPFLEQRSHVVANANLSTRLRRSGTKIRANYGWMADGALVPSHVFTTQDIEIAPGVNIFVRQPLPPMFGMPGHFEVTADLRNLSAQGYLPIASGTDSRNLLVVQSPRGVRGGLNFIF